MFLQITDATPIELEQVKLTFSKKVDNWHVIKKKRPNWNGIVSFVNSSYQIPIGLWKEFLKMCKEHNITLSFDSEVNFYDKDFNKDGFDEWVDNYFNHDESVIQPYSYQKEGAYRALKYRRCTEEISTSGGKTLISYMIFQYLFSTKAIKKLLYIVPSKGLIKQAEDDFYDYISKSGHKPDWTSQCIYSEERDTSSLRGNIIFGTYQSLCKKDPEFFNEVDAIICDECHHAISASIRKVIADCVNSKYTIGLSGTLPKVDSCDSFTISAYIGPTVYTLTSDELITNGKATPVEVVCYDMDYLPTDFKEKLFELRTNKMATSEGTKNLNIEKQIMREHKGRLQFVCNEVIKAEKTSLVLFADILTGYGMRIYNYLREHDITKTYFYMDGGTDNAKREYIKAQMESRDDIIVIASIGTFSEGISVKNIHNIYLTEGGKSEVITAQILGRGMRLLANKELVVLHDFADNYVYGNNLYKRNNYLYKHALERREIYKERKFPHTIKQVKFY
ncbi:MAG: DEAD/DEAH box helicase family protein [Sarcina sp.]